MYVGQRCRARHTMRRRDRSVTRPAAQLWPALVLVTQCLPLCAACPTFEVPVFDSWGGKHSAGMAPHMKGH